ncbi:MAG: chemotaxis protein CheX [Parasporobacterium sp.]|nr:chemotaxis protein CheX [Parasporobacterium sp.]
MVGLDVKIVNPFLQSTISVFEAVAQNKLVVGKPTLTALVFPEKTFISQAGLTGTIKGQLLLVLEEEQAKAVASKMMMGMPVNEIDDMASSALNELCNMIMGNTATLFSTQDILVDITPPISVFGSDLKMNSKVSSLKVPFYYEGTQDQAICLCMVIDDK